MRVGYWFLALLLLLATAAAAQPAGSYELLDDATLDSTATTYLQVSSDDTLAIVLVSIDYDGDQLRFAGVEVMPLTPPWAIVVVNDNQHALPECRGIAPHRRLTVAAWSIPVDAGLVGTGVVLRFRWARVACGDHPMHLPDYCEAGWYPNNASTLGGYPLSPRPPYSNLELLDGQLRRPCTTAVVPVTWSHVRSLYH